MSIGSFHLKHHGPTTPVPPPVMRSRRGGVDDPIAPEVGAAVATLSRRAVTLRKLGDLLLISPEGYRSYMSQLAERARRRSLIEEGGTDENFRRLADECEKAGGAGRLPVLVDPVGCGPYSGAGPSTADCFFDLIDPFDGF